MNLPNLEALYRMARVIIPAQGREAQTREAARASGVAQARRGTLVDDLVRCLLIPQADMNFIYGRDGEFVIFRHNSTRTAR